MRIDRQLMAVSPYALTIKRSAEKLFVWAIDLATGKPVADIPLTAAAYSYDSSVEAEPAGAGPHRRRGHSPGHVCGTG